VRRTALLTAVVALAACMSATGGEDRPSRYDPAVQSQQERTRLRVGDRGFFDDGALQITLRSIDARSARIIVHDVGGERGFNLRAPGPASGIQWANYRIWLESIGIDNSALIVVSRNRGS
jgi:hypothetical protein